MTLSDRTDKLSLNIALTICRSGKNDLQHAPVPPCIEIRHAIERFTSIEELLQSVLE